jgi:hypothetical protein
MTYLSAIYKHWNMSLDWKKNALKDVLGMCFDTTCDLLIKIFREKITDITQIYCRKKYKLKHNAHYEPKYYTFIDMEAIFI